MTAEQRDILTKGMDPATGKRLDKLLPGECYGPLAVHLSWDCEGWTITHVESGYAACHVPDYDVAVELAEGMAGFDWTIPNPTHIPAGLRSDVTTYLRQMKKKHVEITSTAFNLEATAL